jgi:P-type Mg2+ transporter
MSPFKTFLHRPTPATNGATAASSRAAQALLKAAQADADSLLARLQSSPSGLSQEEAERRLAEHGLNEVAQKKQQPVIVRFLASFKNPLIVLLLGLAAISYLTGDLKATIVISAMVVLSVVLRFLQELNADRAAEKLKAMVSTMATVVRDGTQREIPLQQLAPGDVIHLAAGDMVPADVRLLAAKDLFLNQAALTGEALPVEKGTGVAPADAKNALEQANVCFLGTSVESGTATAVVVSTGSETYFGTLARSIVEQVPVSSFDKGISRFTWLMIRFIVVMVPLVFIVNGISKHNWLEAFLFALAVAVGLTPELLPMIVTVNLSQGAIAMSRRKVIVKRLNAIQNLGAMDILCTDKTGTITLGRVILEKHLDIDGRESRHVLNYAYLNSVYQTGLRNLLDEAVLRHEELDEALQIEQNYRKIDEIPFDFVRRRMSVVVEQRHGQHILICKGAVEEIAALCTRVEVGGQMLPLSADHRAAIERQVHELNSDGFRVILLAYRLLPEEDRAYTVADEQDLTLLGFLAFLDPPKESATEAIANLRQYGVAVKILTGDNEVVTTKICREVGLPVDHVLLGGEIEGMSEQELAEAAERTTVFAKLSPAHKGRIIAALQSRKHVVGFMGDGINDAPALRTADVGVSVDTAVDIAKESSDVILLEQSLLVLQEGVVEGRRVFGNITKYIKMAASSNFGNMLSVVGASAFLPFLPMLPLQVLVNNLLYDLSQTPIPSDGVDAEWLARPRQWTIDQVQRFIVFIGPISSIFDYATYFIMLFVFHCWNNPALFRTGWFVESLFTQTLIIHVIRTNKIPFIQSRASAPLTLTSLAIVVVGAALPFSPLAGALGFAPLPPLYWLLLAGMLVCYVLLTQAVKTWFIRRFGEG